MVVGTFRQKIKRVLLLNGADKVKVQRTKTLDTFETKRLGHNVYEVNVLVLWKRKQDTGWFWYDNGYLEGFDYDNKDIDSEGECYIELYNWICELIALKELFNKGNK